MQTQKNTLNFLDTMIHHKDLVILFITILLIPLYNFILQSIDYVFWSLMNLNWVNFSSSPIRTPIVKIFTAIYLLLFFTYSAINIIYLKKGNIFLYALNITLLLICLVLYYFFLSININEEEFFQNKPILSIMTSNKFIFYLCIIIFAIILVYCAKKFLKTPQKFKSAQKTLKRLIFNKKNRILRSLRKNYLQNIRNRGSQHNNQQEINILIYILTMSLLPLFSITFYAIYSFLQIHQNIALNKFPISNTIQVNNNSFPIYPLYCELNNGDNLCVGYMFKNNVPKEYDVSIIFYDKKDLIPHPLR